MPAYRTADGAALVPDADAATVVGPAHYVEAQNVCYEDGYETLRPGWEQYLSDLDNEPSAIHRAENAAGDHEQLCLLSGRIRKRGEDGDWVTVGGGYSTEHAQRWQAVTVQGITIVTNGYDAPAAKAVGGTSFAPIRELREVGVVSVGTLVAMGDYLLLGDITELKEEYRDDWLNTADPYGRPPEAMLTRSPFRILWSDNPLRWKLVAPATISGKVVHTQFRIGSLAVGDKVSFVEAGEQPPEVEDDIAQSLVTAATVTGISANGRYFQLELEEPVEAANGYFFRDDYFEQVSGYDDTTFSGRILAMHPLGEQLVIAMDRGFLLATRTGESLAPFIFDLLTSDRTSGSLLYPHTCVVLGDRQLLYRGEDTWYTLDLSSRRPQAHEALGACDSLFEGLSAGDADALFAVERGEGQEVWICLPPRYGYTVVFDYAHNKVRTIDRTWSALGEVKHPDYGAGAARNWLWLLGNADGTVDLYGYRYEDGETLYTRRGETYEGRIVYGLEGSPMQSTRLHKWDLLAASHSPGLPVTVKLEAFDHANGPARKIFERTLADPLVRSDVRTIAKAAWFQDTLTFTGPVRIAGRSFVTGKFNSRLRGRGAA